MSAPANALDEAAFQQIIAQGHVNKTFLIFMPNRSLSKPSNVANEQEDEACALISVKGCIIMTQHISKRLMWLLIALLCMASLPCAAQARAPFLLTEQQGQYALGRALEYLEDPTGALTIADVTSPPYAERFVQSQQEIPNFGYTDSAYWVRLRFRNAAPQITQWWLELGSIIGYVECYRPGAGPLGFEIIRTGDALPFSTREIAYHRLVFALTLPPEADYAVYLRLLSAGGGMVFPFTLWRPENFGLASRTNVLLSGVFYGALLMLAAYNTFLWVALRDAGYFYYVGHLLSIILLFCSMEGIAGQYLWPNAVWWYRFSIPVFSVCAGMIIIKFTMSALETRTRAPRAHAVFVGLLVIWGMLPVLIPFVSFGSFIRLAAMVRLIGTIIQIMVAFQIWRNGYRPARYALCAWLIANLPGLLTILATGWGLAALSTLSTRGPQLRILLMEMMLSLTLADRIRLLREEKETAQMEAIAALQQQDRLAREQNLLLEQQVAARTEQLMNAKDKAEVANLAKSAFLANMSHELRSPLNAILGFAELMLRSKRNDLEQQENLRIITRSGEHLLSLINQVLDLSKIEAGKIALNPRPFDLMRLLDDLEDMFRLKAEEKQLQLIVERGADVPRNIATDELKLRQALINLLNNALKFTAQGGVTVRVTTVAQTENRARLRFEVEDTGAGIPPEEMGKLFEAFEQTSSGLQTQEGTGLGLPISRKFVQLMGGDMDARSQIGVGTTLSFEIEAERLPDDAAAPNAPKTHHVIALDPGQPRYRMLIVDDKPLNRRLLMKLLSPFGFELREAENGAEAMTICDAWKPRLIWMDMRMPVMDGYEATKRIKATTAGQTTAVIAVTASMLEEERAVTLSVGCDDFLRKPFREQEIFDLITKHLGARFVYEDDAPQADATTNPAELPALLAQLPDDLREQLRDAAECCDIALLDRLILDIRAYQPTAADMLMEKARNFQYELIINAL